MMKIQQYKEAPSITKQSKNRNFIILGKTISTNTPDWPIRGQIVVV